MPDYKNGKIYKLSYDNLTYYGSTATTLKERMWAHKSNYKQWKADARSKCACYDLFDKYGFDNFTIELVENYPCDTKKELFIREQYYIDNFECVNEIAAYTSEEDVREQKKQYNEANKERDNARSKQRYQANKETILENQKQYRQENKEAISEKKKQKIKCECGKICSKNNLIRHRKSAFHLAYIKNLLTI